MANGVKRIFDYSLNKFGRSAFNTEEFIGYDYAIAATTCDSWACDFIIVNENNERHPNVDGVVTLGANYIKSPIAQQPY